MCPTSSTDSIIVYFNPSVLSHIGIYNYPYFQKSAVFISFVKISIAINSDIFNSIPDPTNNNTAIIIPLF